jgi:hypothetical protein
MTLNGALSRFVAAALVAGTAVGCTLDPSPPLVSAVTPGWGYNGEDTPVEIQGAHLYPALAITGADDARILGTFGARLERDGVSIALEGVQHIGYDRLSALVPAGIDPGTYDLRVDVPSGLSTTLDDAFEVTDTRADHLALSVSDTAYTVGFWAVVSLALLDPLDVLVPQSMPVVVRAEPASDAGTLDGVYFAEDQLDGQEALADGSGVRGVLEEDGTGILLITAEAETAIRLVVEPAEDAGVASASQVLSWDPGAVDTIEIELPRGNFRTEAGATFDVVLRARDRYGNLITREPVGVFLTDECGHELLYEEVLGEVTVPLTLTVACEVNRIVAFTGDGQGESEAFEVYAGDLVGYEVTVAPTRVIAGDPALVLVEAVDAYGNLVRTHAEEIALSDDVGGLDPELNIGTQSCPGFTDGQQLCFVSLWRAAEAVVVRAEDRGGFRGAGEPVEVVADAPSAVLVEVLATSVAAGETFDVLVQVTDAYANNVAFSPGGSDPVAFDEPAGTIACTWSGAAAPGHRFACTVERAQSSVQVGASVLGLEGVSTDPLTIVNGPIARVDVDPGGGPFTAGTAFSVQFDAYDAYGNAYVVQTDAVLDLEDTAGTFAPGTAVLGPTGSTVVSGVVYGAGANVRIYASQAGARLGASRAFPVSPAALAGFDVSAPPWLAVDTGATIDVTAADAYGNPVGTYTGVVTLEAAGGSCDPVTTSDFEDGFARVAVRCDRPALSETFTAEDTDGLSGASGVVDVVDLGCSDGPEADLTLNGDAEAVECLTAGSEVEVLADTSASVAGGAGVAVRHFDDGAGNTWRTLAADLTLSWTDTGVYDVVALVVDAEACAGLATGTVYIGADDGEPTGPIDVALSATTVDASAGSVVATVSARDCTGDVAANQEILVRADLGTPVGVASGEGLVVTLDSAGAGSFDWMFDSGYAGDATLSVGSWGGGGLGVTTIVATGDSALPEIVSIEPVGTWSDTIDTLTVEFTEAMLSHNMSASHITLTGPSGNVPLAFSLSSDLTTLTVTPTPPVDGAAGAYTLALSPGVRDTAGNQLDGAWSDVASGFTVTVGDVADTLPTITTCDADVSTFTPDGDEGAADEADRVILSPVATAAPSWWWLLVTDEDGERVRSARQPGTDTAVRWDGRADDGRVAAPAEYRLLLRAVDVSGNIGEPCVVTVELAQHVGG